MGVSLKRTEPGVWISGSLHAALLGVALFAAAAHELPQSEEGVPVEVITENQFSELTKGSRDGEAPAPTPRADRVSETHEERDPGEAKTNVPTPPTRPPDIKVASAEEMPLPPLRPALEQPDPAQAEAARAEAARAEAAKAEAAKAEAAKAEAAKAAAAEAAKQSAKAAAAKAAADAKAAAEAKAEAARAEAARREELAEIAREEAETKAKAEAAKAEAKARADAKAKAEAAVKARAEAQARAEAEAKAKAEAEAKVKALAEKAAADARAEAKAEADAKAKADAEAKAAAVAEAKAKAAAEARAKAVADAKAKAAAEAKARRLAEEADRFNAGSIRDALASRAPSQSTGATGRDVQRTAALGTASGTAQRLNPSQRDALVGLLQQQIERCYSAPPGAQQGIVLPQLDIRLNPDGSLTTEPRILRAGGSSVDRSIAEAAVRAVRRCAPYRIPAQFAPFYNDWRVINAEFELPRA
ncbi:cell envelope integrity protein TolA [Methylobacterium oryzihabitans]|uniref:Cell envelope integrity protein TolA n=1 Tax=Methylobacterium oryzihabitans TaxID=2499852 RepID=A0A437PFN1_9HYPH|nr:cell envelope integrity protein TolA [Methylobacterium oryzihabitans]RVU21090.1 cell envelope integrity protein TolA [Methylobacterium oryzihabitans]